MLTVELMQVISGKNGVVLPPGTVRSFPEEIARLLVEKGAGRIVSPRPAQAPGQATQPGREETGLKTASPGHSDTVAWNSPIFGRLEAPAMERGPETFTLRHPLTNEIVELPNEWIVSMEERASIIEYDGHAPREEADRQAKIEFFGLFRKGGKP